MRVKTSITLPKELLDRSAVVYLARVVKQARDRKDLEIIDKHAEGLNREAADTLDYQQLQ